jgi:secondary thiamine-phosphate synthase enzyme
MRKRLLLQALFVCLEQMRQPVLDAPAMLEQASTTLELRAPGPGLHEITGRIFAWLESVRLETGLLTVFCAHTSASLLIQENAASAARHDLERFFQHVAPENPSLYTHNDEGADDMPAHIRSALTHTHLSIPVQRGKMVLGTWQGIFLFEHRRSPPRRHLSLHLVGNRHER